MTKTGIKSTEESSLEEDFFRRDEISEGNHLWERIFIRRDEISEEKSSLGENFYPQR